MLYCTYKNRIDENTQHIFMLKKIETIIPDLALHQHSFARTTLVSNIFSWFEPLKFYCSFMASIGFEHSRMRSIVTVHNRVTLQRLIESMMGLGPRQGNLRLVFRLFSLMRGLPSIRLK